MKDRRLTKTLVPTLLISKPVLFGPVSETTVSLLMRGVLLLPKP